MTRAGNSIICSVASSRGQKRRPPDISRASWIPFERFTLDEHRGFRVRASKSHGGRALSTDRAGSLEDRFTVSGITTGPIFRGIQRGALTPNQLLPGDVARILKSAAKRAGVPVTFTSGHSLRRGLATTARREGRSLDAIQRQPRHANIRTTINYLDEVELERAETRQKGLDSERRAESGR